MAEPTLSMDYSALQIAVGDFLGLGRDTTAWSTDNTNRVDEIMISGLREFYSAHDWSFLKQNTTIVLWKDIATDSGDTVTGGAYADPSTPLTISGGNTTMYNSMIGRSIVITGVGTFVIDGYTSSTVISVTGDASSASGATFSIDANGGDYHLDDDFGGIEGPYLEFDNSENRITRIRITNASEVMANRTLDVQSSHPQIAALVGKSSDGTDGQRWELRVWPEPDQDYTVHYWKRINPDKLTSTVAYHLGGMQHSECIKLACLAKAELFLDDEVGNYAAMYEQRLAKSIQRDRQHGYSAENLGPMLDQSDNHGRATRWRTNTVTYYGTQY